MARRRAGLTQVQLGTKASVDHSLLSRWENGIRCPRIDVVVRLADAVGVQVRDLLFGIE
jgi:transcriptional regulator with XRE-family HTH domain